MEYTINIIGVCGKNIVTRDDGKIVHDLIMSKWNEVDKIIVDFGNVLIASVSFFDEIFGHLAFQYSKVDIATKIQLRNIQNFDKALLNDILISRFKQKELKGETQI